MTHAVSADPFNQPHKGECGNGLWAQLAHLAITTSQQLQESRSTVLLDIGANKAYRASEWMALWRPSLGLNPRTCYNSLSIRRKVLLPAHAREGEFVDVEYKESQQTRVLVPKGKGPGDEVEVSIGECGMCSDCEDRPLPIVPLHLLGHGAPSSPVQVFAFDGNQEIVENVSRAFYRAFPALNQAGSDTRFHYEHAAFADYVGSGYFESNFEFGHLKQVIDNTAPNPDALVPVKTVDSWLNEKQNNGKVEERYLVTHIDLLKSDCEGSDPLVLAGARGLLRRQGASVVYFEYNDPRTWATTS